jgi:hypothetical protein
MKAYALIAVLLLSFLALSIPVHAQCPGFPVRGVQIIDTLYNSALANGTDDQRRDLTRTFIEQLVYEAPAEGWVWKSADPGRPPSKDSIARMIGSVLCNWDWQNGGTRQRSVQAGQLGDNITGQSAILISGVNHIGSGTPSPVPQPGPPVTTIIDLSPVLQRLDTLYAQAERIFTADNIAADARQRALAGQITDVDTHLKEHDENPSFLRRVLTNPIVLSVVSGVLAGKFVLPGK